MGKKKICPECGEKFKISRKQKARQWVAIQGLKSIRTVGIKELIEETKDLCFDCWNKKFKSYVKPFAQALGKAAEDW